VDGARFLVLELVEGETLSERIQRGPIPIDQALQVAKSICEALEAAHEQGIVHRDLKPANVKITPQGIVKVLDFGLAKMQEASGPVASRSDSPTLLSGSMPGVLMGTAAYMSPEQCKMIDKEILVKLG
jgi:serine/threonine-protein kinase